MRIFFTVQNNIKYIKSFVVFDQANGGEVTAEIFEPYVNRYQNNLVLELKEVPEVEVVRHIKNTF